MKDENGRIVVKTRKDFDELNALSIEDLQILNQELGYEFEVENGKIVAFSVEV